MRLRRDQTPSNCPVRMRHLPPEWAWFQKGKQIINLGRRSFRARVLYFGYSPRDELRLQYPRYSIGARAEMVRFNEAHDKWGLR